MDIFCEFHSNSKRGFEAYVCEVTEIEKFDTTGTILGFFGKHIDGKCNDDVEAFIIREIKLHCFPCGLTKIFPNLKYLSVNSCGLKRINKFDLREYSKLRQLNLNGNRLTILPEDLFKFTQQLETISFYGNQIEFIGLKLLDPLEHLMHANFKMNITIDACYKTIGRGQSLDKLKRIIKQRCQPTNSAELPWFALSQWMSHI